MTGQVWRVLVGLVVVLVALWIGLVISLILARPRGVAVRDALWLLPDTLGLMRRLAGDRSLPRGVRIRIWCLLVYLSFPFDLIPDFIPVLGHADDAIIAVWVLRSVVRKAGSAAIRRHWRGSESGLTALWHAAGLPGTPTEETPS